MKPYTGPPATLGSSAAAQVRLIVWCRDCRHKVEPDPAEQVARYGADLPVRDWVRRQPKHRFRSHRYAEMSDRMTFLARIDPTHNSDRFYVVQVLPMSHGMSHRCVASGGYRAYP